MQKTINYGKIRFVQVKKCPHCHLPMEKGPGCHYISCRCGEAFCWDCGKKWGNGENHHLCRQVVDNFHVIIIVIICNDRKCLISIAKTIYWVFVSGTPCSFEI